MDVVTRMLAVLLTVVALPAQARLTSIDVESALDRWQPMIDQAAHRFAIPASWIRDVMREESAGQTFFDDQPTTSIAGAMGLMQIMPATYAELRERYGLGEDPYDPHDNILAGAAYLHELYERYGWPSLFAAYHAGPGRFEANFSTGKPLPKATRDYLAALIPERSPGHRVSRQPTSIASLFVPLTRNERVPEPAPEARIDDRLFVPLRHVGVAAGSSDINGKGTASEASYAQ